MSFKLLHFPAALALAGMIIAAPLSAQAGHGCLGCNVVDEHVFGPQLVGQTVKWIDHYNIVVAGVDMSSETVTFYSNGAAYAVPARQIYTIESDNERAGVIGTTIVAAGLCLLFGCLGDNKPSSPSTSRPSSDDYNRQCHERCENSGSADLTKPNAMAGVLDTRQRCHLACPDGKPTSPR